MPPRIVVLGSLAVVGAATVALAAGEILDVHDASLTDYLYASATPVQDVRPGLVSFRGTGIDGSMRAGSTFGAALAGNAGDPGGRRANVAGVQLDTGAYPVTSVDLTLPALVPWVVGRTFNVNQITSGSAERDSDGYQGVNWFQTSQPELVFYDDATTAADDILYLVYGADRFVEFQRVNSGSDDFRGVNGAAGAIEFTANGGGEPDIYTYHDQVGMRYVFFGYDADASPAEGQLWKIIDPDGNTAYVGDASTGSTAITNGYDASGRVLYAYDASANDGRRYSYTYTTLDSVDRLTQIKAETKSGGTWASPTGLSEVGKVDYSYYTTSESYGSVGDLKLVKTTTPLSDSGVSVARKTYYRYYTGAWADSDGSRGEPHAIKYIIDAEGYRRADWEEEGDLDDGPLTFSDTSIKPYAAAFFEYVSGSDDRVSAAWFNGECGCSGGNNGTHEFTYETNGSFSGSGGYDTAWQRRAIAALPDGSFRTFYFDEVGQSLSSVVTDIDPASSSPAPEVWATEVVRNSDGQVTEVRSPKNITAYDHSDGTYTNSTSDGLITLYERESTTHVTGFVRNVRWKVGTSTLLASASISSSVKHAGDADGDTISKTVGDATVYRPNVTERHSYAGTSTTQYTGSYKTETPLTAVSSELYLSQRKTKQPTIGVSNGQSQGPSTQPESKSHLRVDQRGDFSLGADGLMGFADYDDNGQLSKSVRDADASGLSHSDFTSGQVPSGYDDYGSPLHLKTTYTYDAQGRPDVTTMPDGDKTKRYYTKLADDRLVTISIPQMTTGGSTTYYGPVSYSVTNHAGKAEFGGSIAFSGGSTTTALTSWIDETDSDPILAVATGTLVRMSTSIYDGSGEKLTESRAYFDIPASGAGTEGTNYDATYFGYDDAGRRWRVKDPTGTISRTVHDDIGRPIEQWVGTNDSTFTGGEPSGTDNMVKVSSTVYDGGSAGGLSLVTSTTAYIQDSATGARTTSYLYDDRGRRKVTLPPQKPYSVVKLDEMGRAIASGMYSSSSGLTASTDPTSVTTNRIALSETSYNDRGQVYKTTVHKIASGGTSSDSLDSESWFDPAGRVIKVRGGSYAKTRYDRLGRATHVFTLAADNDSTTYSNLYDTTNFTTKIDGDVVVEERQTTYEDDSGLVLMSAVIQRFHDDYGGGETTGALDTNADNDALMYTAANLEGRIQITAMWYDELDRVEDTVAYGTYGGSDFDRDGLSVPARSDTALKTTNVYNDDGTLKEVVDPMAYTTRFEYDDLGRRVKVISNYVDGTPGGGTDDDQDRTVVYTFTDGLKTKMTADLPGAGDDQETLYTYGVVKGTSAGESKFAAGNLLQKVTYPDSGSGTDVVTYAYNAQGQLIWQKDQAGNVIEFDYDDSGRREHQRVTTLAGGFDNAVLRITSAYDDYGRVETVTQYDHATAGSGTAVDQVKFTYDEWGSMGGVSDFEQDHNGLVGAGGSVDDYEVEYTYEKATNGRRSVRQSVKRLVYASTLVKSYTSQYGSDYADELSRVSNLRAGATNPVTYDYMGLGTVVGIDHGEPEIYAHLYSTSGVYPNLDRFNRVTTSAWTKDLATDRDFYDVDISYDRNSNITVIEDNIHSGWDFSLTMDDLNRLIAADRGSWSGSAITSPTYGEVWDLDQAGNWQIHQLDLNGDTDYTDGGGELDDDGTFNKANELTARDIDDDSSDDITLSYDAVGNMTDDGTYDYVYDAFGRLRQVKDQSANLVEENWYNGLGYRIVAHNDVDGDGDVDGSDVKFHLVYDTSWRLFAEFRDTDTDPKAIYLHHNAGLDGRGGSSYIDALVFRERDANGNGGNWDDASDGTLEERLYYCQNWRADVVALITDAGGVAEGVRYSPYGVPFGMPRGDVDGDGDVDAGDTGAVSFATPGDVRQDIDLDGDVDVDDLNAVISAAGATLGRGVLSGDKDDSVGNTLGYAGYVWSEYVSRNHVRHRVYDPELGRWTRRDPMGYVDGANLYGYVENTPAGTYDSYGTVKARVALRVKYPHPQCSDCGQGYAHIEHKLDQVAPCEGYLVQKIIATECLYPCPAKKTPIGNGSITKQFAPNFSLKDCNPVYFSDNCKSISYWEAWRVHIGEVIPNPHVMYATGKWINDTWANMISREDIGEMRQFGEARFFCQDVTQMLTDDSGEQAGDVPGWSTSGCPNAGGLVNTLEEPIWWRQGLHVQEESIANISARGDWNCCPGSFRSDYDVTVD
ncbi:MAG: hypothetical protein H6812_10565 [Phycisphaeraceae bacterium]|nr:hypothetical protein [Phycisphaerales bacterium]MCB9843689.1 hypothetical protein [Phycisphaeraceae bacterium]